MQTLHHSRKIHAKCLMEHRVQAMRAAQGGLPAAEEAQDRKDHTPRTGEKAVHCTRKVTIDDPRLPPPTLEWGPIRNTRLQLALPCQAIL